MLESESARARAEIALGQAGIGQRRWYLPAINKHSAFDHIAHFPTPNADVLAARLLGVPFYLASTLPRAPRFWRRWRAAA
jgi:hypothetical protein